MPGSDFKTWIPLDTLADKMVGWADGSKSGLIKVGVKNGKVEYTKL